MLNVIRYLIALICIGIIIIRIIFPQINFDLISLTLLGVAFISLIINNPEKLLSRATKIKLGSIEFELKELNQETENVEKHTSESNIKRKKLKKNNDSEFNLSEDLPTDILKLSIEIEQIIKSVFLIGIAEKHNKPLSIVQSVTILESYQLIDKETSLLIQKFWNIRNKVVHGYNTRLSKKEMLSFLDIGLRVLRILKTVYDKISEGSLEPKKL